MTAQVKLFDDLDAVERDAGDALDRGARPWLFDRLDWYRLVRDHTPPAGKPLAVRVRNGSARAWLFLSVERGAALALSNWYCLRFGAVIDGTDGTAAIDAIPSALRKAGVSRIFISPLAEDDPLPAAFRRRRWLTARSQCNVNWRMPTTGISFDDYWAARPSRLRNTAKRRAKAAKLDLVIHDRFDEAAWRDYESVYQNSWKPAEGSPELMRKLAEGEGAAGTLRLGLAYHEGQAVAAQLWVVEHKVATIHKLAYREDAKPLSPGTVLSMEMFRRAIDVDRVEMIDFGIGNDGYKADWMAEAVPLYALTAYDPFSLRGLIGIARSMSAKLVRRIRSV